jgi:hypothetical protein
MVSRIVRGIEWAHLPGAVPIKTNGNFGKPMPPRGFCQQGHKKTAAGHCHCDALRQRGYRQRRINPLTLATAIVKAAEATP